VHHVGGRDGSRAFPYLKKFEGDVVNVLYDADPDCLVQIRESNQYIESQLHVLPYCLGDARKTTTFNINYDPYTSSLYESNPDYNSYYGFNINHDYIWSEATKVREKRRVEVKSMDYVLRVANIQIPPPDFLSIDTQGSEYEILLGAKETLKSSVVAMVIEAEFHPLYQGQKLFGDLAKLLSDSGFDFVRFLSMDEMSPFRGPIGARGEGFHMSANALFFRRINDIDKIEDELQHYIMYQKLAFIAIVFNQFEYGLECLSRCKDSAIHDSIRQELEEITYYRFLRKLEEKIERVPKILPETFASKYTFEESRSRFEAHGSSLMSLFRNRTRLIYTLKQFPVLCSLLKRIKHMHINKRVSILVKSSLFKRYSDIETLLINYGLREQAKILMENRVVQSRFLSSRCDHSLRRSADEAVASSEFPAPSTRHPEQSEGWGSAS
jgi:FkbM family methyltransferase